MLRKILKYYSNRLVSRWVILILDLLFVVTSFVFAYVLRFNFAFDALTKYSIGLQTGVITTFYLLGFLVFRPYSGIIRHTGLKDVENILKAVFAASISYVAIDYSIDLMVGRFHIFQSLRVPVSIIIIHFLIVAITLVTVRFSIKSFYYRIVGSSTLKSRPVIIYGAGKSGLITKNALEQDDRFKYKVVAFLDDNPTKIGKKLEDIPVLSPSQVDSSFLKQHQVIELIIAIQKINPYTRARIIERFLDKDVAVKNIPATSQWMEGEFSSRQIKAIKIEDLLEREEISLNHQHVIDQVRDKIVLVTGAAGSIGSEIARQLMHYKPKKLILVDQAESPLHELVIDLEQQFNGSAKKRLVSYVSDVCNQIKTNYIFQEHLPQIIYHAAAYKHVPLMELNPSEAIEVNVLGTKNIADLACKYEAESFLLVSTDKAVNPTNIMGASKRIAEMYCQSKQGLCSTKFITTRFGNVLGSNGSVVPLFKKQIERGGPVTITHEEVTRYFMTIPEACELVLEAAAMGKGGEIFVFDMGAPVKIIDLAKKMIKLSGFTEQEIGIKTIGLRPGEKLYEEVLSDQENTVETYHHKIKIAKVREIPHEVVSKGCELLLDALLKADITAMVKQMKNMVPEYVSKNSVFESLDKKDEKGISIFN